MMKKLLVMLLTSIMLISTVACGEKGVDPSQIVANTMGEKLMVDFMTRVDADKNASNMDIAEGLLTNPVIDFAGATMEVEPGYLAGFSNEVHGFSDGVMFSPMIGSIPFVGYIFTTEDASAAQTFAEQLKADADPRWNICTEATETVVETRGNKVFFVMCP